MTDTVCADRIGRDTTRPTPPLTPETPMSTATLSDTDHEAAARRERIAQLQQRRAATSRTAASSVAAWPDPASTASTASTASVVPQSAGRAPTATRGRRSGAASGSKVAAAGFGFAAMLSLVAVMGVAGRPSVAAPQPAAQLPAAPAQIVVVVHPADGTTAQVGTPATASPVPVSSSQPIVLSAQPTVRQAPASQAPTGQTNGSR